MVIAGKLENNEKHKKENKIHPYRAHKLLFSSYYEQFLISLNVR